MNEQLTVVRYEIDKILFRRFPLILLLFTTVLFPVAVKILSYLSVVEDQIPEGLFASHVAYAIISYSQIYLFIPVWIFVLTGTELSKGHVNRVVFFKSRKFYFVSKVCFCGLITLFFSAIGLFTFIISVETAPFKMLTGNPWLYFQFFVQITVSNFTFCTLLLFMIFLFRSPIVAFVVYFGWTITESILFSFFSGVYKLELSWLPFYLVRKSYLLNGQPVAKNYYDTFAMDPGAWLTPVFLNLVILTATYRIFMKSDLKPLSD